MEKEKQLTPMMVQYNSIKSKYKDEVLFYRLGDFYEMFNEDAVEISRLLNLTLTSRAGTPMCGIPYHAAKVYIARLLRLGKKIVVCEQVEETVGGKGIAERKVSEIITPGTAMEAEYLEGNSNNYLAAFAVVHGKAAFAFIDVTTSAFSATSWKASEMEEFFPKELSRCSPRELLLPQSLKNNSLIQAVLSEYQNISLSYYPDWNFNGDVGFKKLARQFNTINLQSFGLSEDSPEVPVAGFLLDYLEKTTNSKIPHVSGITIYHDNQYLVIDDSSRKNLEVVANLRDGSSLYTLLECVNHSRTAMGSRMIRQWLLFPLTNVNEINARQAHVALFVDNRNLQEKLREKLSSILDFFIHSVSTELLITIVKNSAVLSLESLTTRPKVCTALVLLELTPSMIPTDKSGRFIPSSANLTVCKHPSGKELNSSKVILFFFLPSLPVYTNPVEKDSAILVLAEKVIIF
jgi:DNA mismatch repair protein MutS